jgi:hypothetical protein
MVELQKIKDFFQNLDFEVKIDKFIVQEALSDITFKLNDELIYADIRREVRPNHLPIFLGREEDPLLVAADYITPKSKETLKSNGINYIDSFGNAYLNLNHLKIYIEKNNAKPVYNVYSEVFTRAGGQILFHFLQKPELINANYEHLAEISCVSLGSVSKTIKGLLKEGFAVKWDREKKYQLIKLEELLEKWIALLNEKILPANYIGQYTFTKNRFEIIEPNPEFETRWGGESGAAMLTDYLRPEKYTLFTNRPKQDLVKNYRLLPQEGGEISAYTPFWKLGSCISNYQDNNVVAHPLLIYAELIYSGNDRNIETARIIFDEYIKPNL